MLDKCVVYFTVIRLVCGGDLDYSNLVNGNFVYGKLVYGDIVCSHLVYCNLVYGILVCDIQWLFSLWQV